MQGFNIIGTVGRRVAALLFTLSSASALAAIGTTDCASADGQVRRTEEEVWGANVVTWSYQDQKLNEAAVHIAADPIDVNHVVNQDPSLGEQHVDSVVQKVLLSLGDGSTLNTFVICTSVTYPDVYD